MFTIACAWIMVSLTVVMAGIITGKESILSAGAVLTLMTCLFGG